MRLSNLIKRLKVLEKSYGLDEGPEPGPVIILAKDCSGNPGSEKPIARFLFGDKVLYRDSEETFEAFEARALREAAKDQPEKVPGRPTPQPVLIGLPAE